jgi:hypothetical protein
MEINIPMVLARFVVITENICEFYKVIEGRAYRMGFLFVENHYEEVLMYKIDRWNEGEEVELLT